MRTSADPAFSTVAEAEGLTAIETRVEPQIDALAAEARALVVTSPDEAVDAAEFLGRVVSARKAVEGWFAPLVEAAHRAHRALTARRAETLARFAEPERIVKTRLADFRAAEEAVRRAAQQAAAKAAREEAERRQIAAAEAALTAGDDERAERILGAPPPPVLVPIVATAPTKLDGVAFVDVWKFEIVDKSALPREYLLPDEAGIGKVVRALKDRANIPGVRVWSEKQARVGVRE